MGECGPVQMSELGFRGAGSWERAEAMPWPRAPRPGGRGEPMGAQMGPQDPVSKTDEGPGQWEDSPGPLPTSPPAPARPSRPGLVAVTAPEVGQQLDVQVEGVGLRLPGVDLISGEEGPPEHLPVRCRACAADPRALVSQEWGPRDRPRWAVRPSGSPALLTLGLGRGLCHLGGTPPRESWASVPGSEVMVSS